MYGTEGIVLKKLDVGEADTLYRIYTKDYGVIRALAQGVRKEEAKLRGHLEVLSLSRIQFIIGRGGEKLIGATLAEFWPRMRAREQTLSLAAAAASEIDRQCFPGEKDAALWELLFGSFVAIDREGFLEEDASVFLANFRGRLRECLGYGASEEEGIL
ncbi:MAG: DNA repair protein RecO (recombination protein O) [Parcubacteria group bacterium Greene0714_36]|nr:MAG: DNA repair protein RecO (recombination protein O) [Parcubacteria group bacterium Greene0714_36]